MLDVILIAVGKLKERFYLDAVSEYQKRMTQYCNFTLIELPEERLPDDPSPAQIEAALAREAETIRRKIPRNSYLIICTPEGRELSSEELSDKLASLKAAGRSSICFVIGSSFGISTDLKRQADFRLSFSRMTFPHHLFRVMLCEQIYRAQAIEAGSRYHK